jgi:hypothetical protein
MGTGLTSTGPPCSVGLVVLELSREDSGDDEFEDESLDTENETRQRRSRRRDEWGTYAMVAIIPRTACEMS